MKQQLFSVLRMLKPPHSVYQHLHFRGTVKVQTPGGAPFRVRHEGYQDENELFWVGLENCWEKESFRLWMALCRLKSAPIIFDAGANNGIYSLVAQAVNPSARIYAFEPVPQIFKRLEANIRANHFSVTTEPYAISDQSGEVTLFVPPTEHSYSASLDPRFPSLSSDAVPVKVRAVSFADYRQEKNISALDILKIDIEGFEPQALIGLREDLNHFKPAILLEVLTEEAGKTIESIVMGLDYLYYNIDEKRGPIYSDHIGKSFKYNYFICQPETARLLGLDFPL